MFENKKNLKQFIRCGVFSTRFNDINLVINHVETLITKSHKIRITYGETYDEYGLTIDSLKYYVTLATLSKLIRNTGTEVETSIIVGDIASLMNLESNFKKTTIQNQIDENIIHINKIIAKFGFKISIEKMSELLKSDEFNENFKKVTQKYNDSKELQKQFQNIVLKNKLKQERKKDFKYTRQEIALIMNYQFKIGPPREKIYDKIANEILPCEDQLLGIYLKPTYPLGVDFDYFVENEEIEKFGLTPYKAGSNRLQNNRMIFGKVDRETLDRLLVNSYNPENPNLPNPVRDLYITLDLLRRYSEEDFEFPNYQEKFFNLEEIHKLLDKYLPEVYE